MLGLQYTAVAALDRRITIWKMLIHWFLCFWGNLAGSLFLMAIVFGCMCKFTLSTRVDLTDLCVFLDGGVFEADPFLSAVQTFVHKKQVVPAFYQIFLKAIGCNWLVCLACYLGMQGRDLASKVIGLWWPIFAFVSLGLDHVVANMFIIPMGIWLNTPDVTVALYIWKGTVSISLSFRQRSHSLTSSVLQASYPPHSVTCLVAPYFVERITGGCTALVNSLLLWTVFTTIHTSSCPLSRRTADARKIWSTDRLGQSQRIGQAQCERMREIESHSLYCDPIR